MWNPSMQLNVILIWHEGKCHRLRALDDDDDRGLGKVSGDLSLETMCSSVKTRCSDYCKTDFLLHQTTNFHETGERAIEMDRVPPRDAVAWGPNGRIGDGENPLDRAAMDALRDIKKSKRVLERKEEDVEEAKEEVVTLKA